MKKGFKYLIGLVVVLFIAYNSVYFRKLSEVKAAGTQNFNAVGYARTYLTTKLPSAIGKAMPVGKLFGQLKAVPAAAFDQYGHALAIGSTRFFLTKGAGRITKIGDNDITLVTDTGHLTIRIATEYVYGNAVRDASGLVDINTFSSTTDLNNVSAEIDKIIRKEVIPPFKAAAKPGDHVQFTGALELNQAHLNLDDAEIIPVTLQCIP